MPDLTAKRTLVKSPPELWSELSEVERLARHLGAFGEIKITKLEPEHTVAWEGESACGTVSIEPSGWGTRVTLTAQLGDGEAPREEPPAAETAAGEGERDLPVGGETEVAEPVVGVPLVEKLETGESSESAGEEHLAEEPLVEEPVSEDEVPEEPEVEEAEVHAPEAEEPVTPQAAGPIPDKPRRKRGFLAWLFRPRTSAHVPPPPVATPSAADPPAATPAEPVDQAPAIEEALVVEEATREEEAHDPEARSSPEEPPSSELPQVTLFDGPMIAQPPHGFAESGRVMQEPLPVPGGVPVEPEASPVPEVPDLSAELAAAEQASPPPGLDPERAQAILDEALDALGSAHHRPYSRG
jgi:hypothetical protein